MYGVAGRRRARTAPGRSEVGGGARIIALCPSEPALADHAGAGRRPLVVAVDEEGYAAALTEIAGAGWRIAAAGATDAAEGICTLYPVRDRGDAADVVLAGLRGRAVLARIEASEPGLVDDLLEDLSAIGPVQHRDAAAVHLDVDTWRLVHRIVGGATLRAAAQTLHVSPRTAQRRLNAARDALGTESRAQLVRAATASGRVPPAITDR